MVFPLRFLILRLTSCLGATQVLEFCERKEDPQPHSTICLRLWVNAISPWDSAGSSVMAFPAAGRLKKLSPFLFCVAAR